MRVGIIALQHESNTFLPAPTTLEDFRREVIATGPDVLRHYQGGNHEVGGFFEGLGVAGIEACPICAAAAVPGGVVTAKTYHFLLEMMLNELRRAGPIDGLLVAPHGAGVCESELDLDGHWLTAVRRQVGEKIPMICTIDPHANLSARMVNVCQAIIPYRTNPHVDQRQRGIEAAALMARALRAEVRPTLMAAFPPVAINIATQHTESSPCRELIAFADEQLRQSGVLSNGVVLGFPYADVEEMGSSFVVTTNNDPVLARYLVNQLSNYLVANRSKFVAHLPGVEQAIREALESPPPVCLLDLGDNVGGGSPGDGTIIAHALRRMGVANSLICLCDPAAVEAACAAGCGSTLELSVGGKTDRLHGQPLLLNVRVRSLHAGKFSEPNVRHSGKSQYDMGQSAVLEGDGLTILAYSVRTPPFSLNQITSCDLQPDQFRIIVAKGVNAPIAAYSPVCRTFIRVDTPGVTTAAMTRLDFKHRRRPLFPFEDLL